MEFFWLIVLGSAVWVGIDASRLGARQGKLGGGLLDQGPVAWFFACLLVWIIGLPCYLATRPRLVAAQGFGGPAPWGYQPYPGGQTYPGSQPHPGSQAYAGQPGSGPCPGQQPYPAQQFGPPPTPPAQG